MIENYCGMHVERQTSTQGWKYRIIMGGLEGVNPEHVSGSSAKVKQTRSALYVCNDDLCNGWDVLSWPLPPIAVANTRDSMRQCFACDESDDFCLSEAAKADIVTCEDG